MFVKWSCGCVGIKTDEVCVVIDDCDGDDFLITAYRPDLETKSFKPLSDEARHTLIRRMSKQLLYGYKWDAFLTLMAK